MTIVKSRESQKHDYEINRLSSKLGVCVIGGASKLLNYAKKYLKSGIISSFADLRITDGNVYEKIGFYFDYEIRPRYSYVGNTTNWKRKHRFNYTKGKLVRKLGEEFKNMSEKEITEINGIYRLYDCGYIKYSTMI